MRVGVSGAHGTGKTTLVQELCGRLAGHLPVDEPYFLLEEEGYEFGFPPSLDDYRAQLRCSLRLLRSAAPRVVFDRTPLDFLAYLAALGASVEDEADPSVLRSALASLDVLIVTPVTPETERVLPRPGPAPAPGDDERCDAGSAVQRPARVSGSLGVSAWRKIR